MSTTIDLLLAYVNAHNAPGGGVFKKIKKDYPDICEIIDNTMPGRCWTEKLYRYTHPDHKDTCKMCSARLLYVNWERGFQTYCSKLCKHSDPEFKQKVKNSFVEKFGTDNSLKSKEVQEKIKQTNLKRYGHENAAKNPMIQSRMRETCLAKYGIENVLSKASPFRDKADKNSKEAVQEKYGVASTFSVPDILNKRKDTWLKKYGAIHPHKNRSVRDNYNTTVKENWGVEHPMQVAEVLDKNVKNAKKSKKFIYPSGKMIMVQGHEPKALEILLNEGIKEEHILNLRVDMPGIWYLDANGKKHRYYPDFFIPHLNLVIEVKSVYTSQMRPDLLQLKMQAASDAGYQIRLMIL